MEISKYELSNFFELAIDIFIIVDKDGSILKVNPSFERVLGYSESQVLFKPFDNFLHPDDVENTMSELKNLKEGLKMTYFENRYKAKNGKYLWFGWTTYPDIERGLMYSVARNITGKKDIELELAEFYIQLENNIKTKTKELIEANHLLKKSIEDNKVLLKEVHHRVKNNLQLISSLYQVYSSNFLDTKGKIFVDNFRGRLTAISLVYNLLSEPENFHKFDIEGYIKQLFSKLMNTYNIKKEITLNLDIKLLKLNINTIVPLGLIINEIISNSLKHAFNNSLTGSFFIKIENKQGDYYTVLLGDDGSGTINKKLLNDEKTLGIQLINTLTKQLEGNIELLSGPGLIYRLSFKDQTTGSVFSKEFSSKN